LLRHCAIRQEPFATDNHINRLINALTCKSLGLAITYVISKGFFENGILMPPGPGSTRPFYLIFSFTWTMVFSTMAMSVISAIIASFLAGLKVAKMPIAKALRS
jgi:putative ABC transport system permease protein